MGYQLKEKSKWSWWKKYSNKKVRTRA